jgi:hypothetical protein
MHTHQPLFCPVPSSSLASAPSSGSLLRYNKCSELNYCAIEGKRIVAQGLQSLIWTFFQGVTGVLLHGTVFLHTERLKFSPRPVNKKLELGSSARVYCKAQGALPPVIKWFKVMCIHMNILRFYSPSWVSTVSPFKNKYMTKVEINLVFQRIRTCNFKIDFHFSLTNLFHHNKNHPRFILFLNLCFHCGSVEMLIQLLGLSTI